MTVRLLGGGMLIFAALALGFMARRRAADHLHALERALTLVRHAKREIELFGTPCGMLFAHYGETVDDAWMNRLYAELDSDSASIRDFFARLGGGYREDTLRLKVAKAIGAMLEQAGLVVRINDYDAENIEYALVATDYDLYLGQTMLSPNMDLSEFFDDDGNLSYAGLSDANMYALCLQALENHGNYYTLHYNVMTEGRLCPLLFRSYAVYATRGMLTDLTPSRNNVFYYSIGKSMEDARIES